MLQVLALILCAVIAIASGRFLGRWVHRALYRMSLLARTPADDRVVMRLGGPIMVIVGVIAWHLALEAFALSPGVLAFARTAAGIALLVGLAWAMLRVIESAIEAIALRSRWITGHRLSQSLLPVARRLARIVLVAIVAVMVLSELGYAVSPLVAGLGITGIAVALAAQKTLENVFGAFAIGVDHPFREGDVIKLDNGLCGTVEAIGLRSTRVRTPHRTLVTIPNGRLADAQIESLTDRDRARFSVKLKLELGATASQLEHVLADLRALLRAFPQHSAEPPTVHLVNIAESWFELEATAWFDVGWTDFQPLRDRLLMRCLEVVANSGVKLHGVPNPPIAPVTTRPSNVTLPRPAGGLS
jgi:MscS family membrane protein